MRGIANVLASPAVDDAVAVAAAVGAVDAAAAAPGAVLAWPRAPAAVEADFAGWLYASLSSASIPVSAGDV